MAPKNSKHPCETHAPPARAAGNGGNLARTKPPRSEKDNETNPGNGAAGTPPQKGIEGRHRRRPRDAPLITPHDASQDANRASKKPTSSQQQQPALSPMPNWKVCQEWGNKTSPRTQPAGPAKPGRRSGGSGPPSTPAASPAGPARPWPGACRSGSPSRAPPPPRLGADPCRYRRDRIFHSPPRRHLAGPGPDRPFPLRLGPPAAPGQAPFEQGAGGVPSDPADCRAGSDADVLPPHVLEGGPDDA